MIYKCRISDSRGKTSYKKIQADNSGELEGLLKDKGLYLISFEEERNKGSLRGRQHKAVLELTQSLALMVRSGLSLKEAFEVADGLYSKGKTAMLVNQLNRRLQRGESFAKAVESQGELFPPLFTGMIRVGQKLGQLDKILDPLALWLRERKELREKILGALIYPAMVLFLVFFGISALLIFFMPQMEALVPAGNGTANPGVERALSSARLIVYLFAGTLIAVPFIITSVKRIGKNYPSAALAIDRVLLTIPVVKNFLITKDMLSMTFALTVLTQCGIPLEEALNQTADVLENSYLKSRILILQSGIVRGESLSELLSREKAFPPELARWTALGERTGSIDSVFGQLKGYYQQEMSKILDRIITLVEPMTIVLLGVILLIIILNVLLPLLTMYGGMV